MDIDDLDSCFDAPISESSSPAVVIVALSKWVSLMRAMDASGDKRHRDVLSILQENPSYDELGQQLVDNIVGAVETKYTFGSD